MFGFDRKPKPDGPDSATAEADRRGAERVGAEQLPHVSAQLSAAGDIRLIDISKTGARFESQRRLPPNSSVSLRLATADSTLVVSGRVVRSRIVRLPGGALGCEVGVAFTKPLTGLLEEGVTTASVTVEETPCTPEPESERSAGLPQTEGLANAFQQLAQPATLEHDASAATTPAADDRARAIESLRDAHAALESQLATAQKDLRKSLDAHSADRTAWDATREMLETQLRNARQVITARDDVVATLQAKLGQATEAHATALPIQGERDQLASQLDAAQEALRAWAELESTLQADMRRANETLASERVAWDQAREELESRLAGANSALEVSETAIASVRKELTMTDVARRVAEQAQIDDRREFDDAIRTMQAELARAGDAQRAAQSDTHANIEDELARVRTELQVAQATLTAERTVWESARQQWRTTVANADAVHAAERQQLEDALRSAQADRDAAARHRVTMEEQLRDSWSRADSVRAEADSLRARLNDAQAQSQSQEVDVDIQVAREDQSRQSLLLEEVGRLAMGMAPQIEGALGSDSTRALALVRQLSRFAQKRSKTLADVDLNDAVRRAEPILRQLVGIDIDFTIELGQAQVIGSGDVDQLLTSLVVSGRDLLPMGGSLVLKMGDGLAIHVSGYGVQPAQPVPALAFVAQRCGGELRLSGEAGQYSVLEVLFPRVNPA